MGWIYIAVAVSVIVVLIRLIPFMMKKLHSKITRDMETKLKIFEMADK